MHRCKDELAAVVGADGAASISARSDAASELFVTDGSLIDYVKSCNADYMHAREHPLPAALDDAAKVPGLHPLIDAYVSACFRVFPQAFRHLAELTIRPTPSLDSCTD